MQNNSNKPSTGVALLLTLGIMMVIGLVISAFEPKCNMGGYDNEAKEGSSYCYLHDLSYRLYGNPDIHEVRENSKKNRDNNSESSDQSSLNNSSNNTPTNKNTTSKKTNDTYNSYDEGYEDIYDNDDYDMDRYYNDEEYAAGVDDAMDELGW